MATFVIGDVQGCFASLQALVRAIDFDPVADELWFVGDLVNRGPANAEVLRWVRDLGDRATVVLGNHDIHLLALAAGVSQAKRLDTVDDVLGAPDCGELVDWLRGRPAAFRRGSDVLVHAGVLPEWSIDEIVDLGAELSDALQSSRWAEVLEAIRKGRQTQLDGARGLERLAAIAAVLQRVRVVGPGGELSSFSGSPARAPEGFRPWFDIAHARGPDSRILFGHWSALGLLIRDDAVCLDSGCVWGRELTAIELESGQLISVAAREQTRTAGTAG